MDVPAMNAVKAGDWITLAEGGVAFGVAPSTFYARARTADLKTRLGPDARKQVRLTSAFIAKWGPPAGAAAPERVTTAPAPKAAGTTAGAETKPPFQQLASLADLLGEDLRREAGEHRQRGSDSAAMASTCAAVVMDNLAVLIRAADEHLSGPHEESPDVR